MSVFCVDTLAVVMTPPGVPEVVGTGATMVATVVRRELEADMPGAVAPTVVARLWSGISDTTLPGRT